MGSMLLAHHAFETCQAPCKCGQVKCHYFHDGGDPLLDPWVPCGQPLSQHAFLADDLGGVMATDGAMQSGEAGA